MANEETTTKKDEKVSIKITAHSKFTPLIDSMYIDSTAFCEEICNVLFNSVFKDYYGSRVEITQNHAIGLCIFFKEQQQAPNDTRVSGIERTITPESMRDMNTRIREYNNSISPGTYRNQFKLTKDAKDLLEDLIPGYFKSNNGTSVNWDRASQEECSRTIMNQVNQTCMKVHVDIHKIVKLYYGAKDDESGESYQYMVSVGNPINPVFTNGGGFMSSQWQLFIHRLKTEAVDKIGRMYGMSSQNNLGIITQTAR